jgi:hypothetical protein
MKTIEILIKTGVVAVFFAAVSFGCNYDRPASNPTDDTSTSEAIVEKSGSAANLNNPRPAPIGDTSVTPEQANRFGKLKPNQDSVARAMHELDKAKRKKNQ